MTLIAYSIGDLSDSFYPILVKVGTHDLCGNTKKTRTDFVNFALKIFGEFLKVYMSSGAL